jgi:hypothetical protein
LSLEFEAGWIMARASPCFEVTPSSSSKLAAIASAKRKLRERDGIDAAMRVAAMTLAFYQCSASSEFHRRQGPLLVTPKTAAKGRRTMNKTLKQIARSTDGAVRQSGGIAHIDEALPAPVERFGHLPAKSNLCERRPIW